MSELLLSNGKRVFYEYDTAQDMLYMLFREQVGPTHYRDVPNAVGVMLRYDNSTVLQFHRKSFSRARRNDGTSNHCSSYGSGDQTCQ